jgi:hypothetical protein
VLRRDAAFLERVAEESAVGFAPEIRDNLGSTEARHASMNTSDEVIVLEKHSLACAHLPVDRHARESVDNAQYFEAKHAYLLVLKNG